MVSLTNVFANLFYSLDFVVGGLSGLAAAGIAYLISRKALNGDAAQQVSFTVGELSTR